jgi:flagellar biosynthetic protein FliR
VLNIQIHDHNVLVAFWLVFTRWLAIMMQLPLFDNVAVPMLVKILTTLLLSYAFFPMVEAGMVRDVVLAGDMAFWTLTIFNTVVGLVIGFFVKAIMSTFVAAGAIITQQVGFAAVRYFDPQSSEQIGPFEQLIQWTMLIIIVSSGAMLPMFKGALSTFHSIHAYGFARLAQSPEFYIEMFKSIFLASLLLSTPMIFTNMLIMAVLGIISRTVPQMNIIMVSFVLNIGLGLLVFAAGSGEFFQVAFKFYTEQLGRWFQFVG